MPFRHHSSRVEIRGDHNKSGNAAAIFFIHHYGFGVGSFLDPTQFVLSDTLEGALDCLL